MGRENGYAQLKKILAILIYLSEHRFGATVQELSKELGVTQRTVYRILKVFREMDIPIQYTLNEDQKRIYRLGNRPRMAGLLGIV